MVALVAGCMLQGNGLVIERRRGEARFDEMCELSRTNRGKSCLICDMISGMQDWQFVLGAGDYY